jgi:hypothetical protein
VSFTKVDGQQLSPHMPYYRKGTEMTEKIRHNYWLDVTIFVTLLISVTTGFLLWWGMPHELGIAFLGFPRAVWVTFHICSGMISLAGVVTHVSWHWDWLKALRGRPLSRMSEKLRLNRIVDRIIWITFIAANATGALAWAMHFGDDIYFVTVPDRLHAVVGIPLDIALDCAS